MYVWLCRYMCMYDVCKQGYICMISCMYDSMIVFKGSYVVMYVCIKI